MRMQFKGHCKPVGQCQLSTRVWAHSRWYLKEEVHRTAHKTNHRHVFCIAPFRGMQGCNNYMLELPSKDRVALVSTRQRPATLVRLGRIPSTSQIQERGKAMRTSETDLYNQNWEVKTIQDQKLVENHHVVEKDISSKVSMQHSALREA